MKVYIMTIAKPLCAEEYYDVKRSKKEAEKAFREAFPFMRKSEEDGTRVSYHSEKYDVRNPSPTLRLLFIREVEI